jgi:hypothetical protein
MFELIVEEEETVPKISSMRRAEEEELLFEEEEEEGRDRLDSDMRRRCPSWYVGSRMRGCCWSSSFLFFLCSHLLPVFRFVIHSFSICPFFLVQQGEHYQLLYLQRVSCLRSSQIPRNCPQILDDHHHHQQYYSNNATNFRTESSVSKERGKSKRRD